MYDLGRGPRNRRCRDHFLDRLHDRLGEDRALVTGVHVGRHVVLRGHGKHVDDLLVRGTGRVVDPEPDAYGTRGNRLGRDPLHLRSLLTRGRHVGVGDPGRFAYIGMAHGRAIVHQRAIRLERVVPAPDVHRAAVHADCRGDAVLDLVTLRLVCGPDPGQDVHESGTHHQPGGVDHAVGLDGAFGNGDDVTVPDRDGAHRIEATGRVHDPAVHDGDVGALSEQRARDGGQEEQLPE